MNKVFKILAKVGLVKNETIGTEVKPTETPDTVAKEAQKVYNDTVVEEAKNIPNKVLEEFRSETVKVEEFLKVRQVGPAEKQEVTLSLPATKEPKGLLPAVPIVVFKNVTKKFGDKVALENINFQVDDILNSGELISIVGPSGCGKSTLIKIIAGLEPHFPATIGETRIFGNDIKGPTVEKGVVDQKYSLLPHLTVVDNIAFGPMLHGMSKKERRDQAREWIKKIGLEGSENKYPNELSGGMQQRVSLAATLILKPKIILMDEPFGALDPKNRLKMQELLVGLWREIQATIFIVTHDMAEAVYLGDRVYRMENNPGRLVEILEVPRPDCPPEAMRKKKWFFDIVAELSHRVENGHGAQGQLSALRKLRNGEMKGEEEVDLLKLIS